MEVILLRAMIKTILWSWAQKGVSRISTVEKYIFSLTHTHTYRNIHTHTNTCTLTFNLHTHSLTHNIHEIST